MTLRNQLHFLGSSPHLSIELVLHHLPDLPLCTRYIGDKVMLLIILTALSQLIMRRHGYSPRLTSEDVFVCIELLLFVTIDVILGISLP